MTRLATAAGTRLVGPVPESGVTVGNMGQRLEAGWWLVAPTDVPNEADRQAVRHREHATRLGREQDGGRATMDQDPHVASDGCFYPPSQGNTDWPRRMVPRWRSGERLGSMRAPGATTSRLGHADVPSAWTGESAPRRRRRSDASSQLPRQLNRADGCASRSQRKRSHMGPRTHPQGGGGAGFWGEAGSRSSARECVLSRAASRPVSASERRSGYTG